MSRILPVVLFVLIACSTARTSSAAPQSVPPTPTPTFDGVLFRLRPGATPPAGAVHLFGDRYRLAEVGAGQIDKVGELTKVGFDVEPNPVVFVDPAGVLRGDGTPTDPLAGQQYSLAKMGVPAAHEVTRGAGVKVAIVDSGVMCGHRDLGGQCLAGKSFVSGVPSPDDDHGHGTHVAGIVAAKCDEVGIAGVACQSSLIPVKALSRTGGGDHGSIAAGIVWAADQGARVINLSLGGPYGSDTLQEALRYAVSKGALPVCAAGNDGRTTPSYPAAYPECVSVVATDRNDGRATFSNYGPTVDVSAPGVQVLSTVLGDQYQAWDGTSMAAPGVAGVAALIFAAHPDWTPAQVRAALEAGAVDLGTPGRDDQFGAGLANAARSLQGVAPLPSPTPAPPASPAEPASRLETLISTYRAQNGLTPAARVFVPTDVRLRAAAAAHNRWMREHNCFAHTCPGEPDPLQRARDAGYPAVSLGENIAKGFRDVDAVFQGWLNSDGHRAAILTDYWTSAIGCDFLQADGMTWASCEFARTSTLVPIPTAQPMPTRTPTPVSRPPLPTAAPMPTARPPTPPQDRYFNIRVDWWAGWNVWDWLYFNMCEHPAPGVRCTWPEVTPR